MYLYLTYLQYNIIRAHILKHNKKQKSTKLLLKIKNEAYLFDKKAKIKHDQKLT